MGIFDLYSKRQKKLRGEVPEIYRFDTISKSLKIQITHIWDDAFGIDSYGRNDAELSFNEIHNILCREYGVYHLINKNYNGRKNTENYFLETTDHEIALDIIEITFGYINKVISQNPYEYPNKKVNAEEAIEELNERFKEASVGYSFVGNEIIRVDSVIMHNEITKPTIALTWNNKFLGANEEYLKAHDHYKKGHNKECLAECLKAFESTMKTICIEKDWEFSSSATAKSLIQICFERELIPSFTQNQYTSLRSLLESGIPAIRNKLGGHGQGQVPQKVDDEMTRYALNLTGANIIFLIEHSGL